MALTLLPHLPPELISHILQYLSSLDIISCRRTCRTLYNLCNDSRLRYLVEIERCGVNDDLSPGLCYPDRLRILERREKAWAMLDFRKPVQVCVPFDSTGIYDFTGGAFLLGTRLYSASRRPTIGYSYVSLPSFSEEEDQKEVQWMGLNLGIQILDVGLAVHEHDLIAALTACVSPLFFVILKS
jgi:F-box domain